jgi:hypothetical protein
VTTGAGNNSVVAGGDSNTITTGDGVASVVADGSYNTVTIGNTPVANQVWGGGGDDGWQGSWSSGEGDDDGSCGGGCAGQSDGNAGSFVSVGDFGTVFAGNGDNTIVGQGGSDTVFEGTGDDSVFLLSGASAGNNTVYLGNGTNSVFLTGSGNTVYDGAGSDTIWSGTGNDTFVANAAGGSETIFGFGATDQIDLSQVLAGLGVSASAAGLAGVVSVTTQGNCWEGWGAVDTVITATGSAGTAQIVLADANVGGLAGLLAGNNLVA